MTKEFEERVPFNAVFSLKRGLNITRANYQKDGIPCLSYGDVHSRYLGFVDPEVHPLPKVSESYIQTSSQCLLKAGDFVFADTSEDYEGVGNCTCVLNVSQGLFAGYHTTVASPDKKAICSRYYGYYFLSDDFRNQIRKEVAGIKVFSITNSILNATRLLSPGLKTQEKIATFLDKKLTYVDGLIVQKREVLRKLSEYRQSLITKAVTKGLNPNVEMKDGGLKWLEKIPKTRTLTSLKHLTSKIGSGKTPLGGSEVYCDIGTKIVRSQNVHSGRVNLQEARCIPDEIAREMDWCSLKNEDVLINITGASIGRAGVVCANQPNAVVNQHVCILRLKDKKTSPQFLSFYLNSKVGQEQISYVQNGASRESLTFEQLGNFKIPCPSIEEQKAIAKYLNDKVETIDFVSLKIKKTIDLLTEYRSSLISAAVTGKLSLEEISHEP